jgi:hypothetical protein
MERLEAMIFALAMARDGGTGSLAQHMLSIRMQSMFSSLVNRPMEARNVFSLTSSDNKADRSKIASWLSHTFWMAPSLTLYFQARALLLEAFVLLSFKMISQR